MWGETPIACLLAQFNISVPGVDIEVGGDDDEDDASDENDASDEVEAADDSDDVVESSDSEDGEIFSGDVETYLDDYNGFAMDIPVEFPLTTSGQTTNWTGPILDGSAVSIYINAAPIPGVSAQTLYDANFQQYQQDRFYTDVEPVEAYYIEEGQEPVRIPAFRAKEVDNRRGSRDMKAPDDIHRWHLFLFGNERTYTYGFTGSFQTFQDGDVQEIYEVVIDSAHLVPIVE